MSISSRKAGVDSYRNQLAKNKAYSKAHLNIPRIFNGLVRTHTNRELVGTRPSMARPTRGAGVERDGYLLPEDTKRIVERAAKLTW